MSNSPPPPHGGSSYCCQHPFQPMHRICINTQTTTVVRAYLKSLLKRPSVKVNKK